MARFEWNLSGEARVQEVLKDLPRRIQRAILQPALEEGAVPIMQQAVTNLQTQVRVTGVKTDPIGHGMYVGRHRRRRTGRVGISIRTPRRARLGISKEAKWYYPAHIEFGTKRTPAKPYMRTAAQQKRGEALQIIRSAIFRGIEELF
jgi:hypothetical protein